VTPKAVFLDIDGTLLTRAGVLPESAADALRRAHENGHHLILSSGRARVQIWPAPLPFDLFDGIISAAGACVTYRDQIIQSFFMDPAHIRSMTEFFEAHQMPFFYQADDALYITPWAFGELREALLQLNRSDADYEELLNLMTVVDHPEDCAGIEKAVYYNCPLSAAEVQSGLTDYFHVTDGSFRLSRFCDGEVTVAGVDKASGIAAYLKAAGIPWEDSIAFGDGPNDHEMLDYVHTSVAMGNADTALKQSATLVCGHVDHDGLRSGFQTLGLI